MVQNRDAFAFTDALLGDGVRYETAGSLMGGCKTWIRSGQDRNTKNVLEDIIRRING